MHIANPDFYDAEDGDGKPIPDDLIAYKFQTGDKLIITYAETDMATVPHLHVVFRSIPLVRGTEHLEDLFRPDGHSCEE